MSETQKNKLFFAVVLGIALTVLTFKLCAGEGGNFPQPKEKIAKAEESEFHLPISDAEKETIKKYHDELVRIGKLSEDDQKAEAAKYNKDENELFRMMIALADMVKKDGDAKNILAFLEALDVAAMDALGNDRHLYDAMKMRGLRAESPAKQLIEKQKILDGAAAASAIDAANALVKILGK
jgi:hypothetical protein